MSLDGNRLGTAIKDALVAAGIIKSEKEVHEWTVTSAGAGTYAMTIDHADWDESATVSYEADAGDSIGDIRDGLKAAAEADGLAGALFDWSTPAADVVQSTVKTAGGTYTYGSTGSLSDAAGTAVTDSSIETEAETTWQTIAGEIVSEIDANAELNSTSTGTPGVID